MKRIAVILFCVFCAINANAQSHERGDYSFQLGYNAGLQTVQSSTILNNITTPTLNSSDFTSMVVGRIHRNIFNFFSVGLSGEYGNFYGDSTSNLANKMRSLNAEARLYVLNRDHFNVYGGCGFGISTLKISHEAAGGNNEVYNFFTPNMHFHVGFNWYLFNIIGVNAQLGWSKKNFELQKYTINEAEQDITNLVKNKDMEGVELQVGLSMKI